MKFCGLVLLAVASLPLFGASDPLNPLVMRRGAPSGAAPAECAEGVSSTPLSPRVDITEVPLPAPAPSAPVAAPPSGALRDRLRATQDALARNNRAAFDAELAGVKQTLDGFPRGGERTAAEELVRIWSDTARVWDAQFESPFFGEDSPLYTTLSAYPGFAAAMRDRVLIDDRDRKFYPADESRDFLSRLAAARLGGRSVAATPQRRVPTKIRTEDEEEDPKTALPPVVKKKPATSTSTARPRSSSVPKASSTAQPRTSSVPKASSPAKPRATPPPATQRAVVKTAPPAAAPAPPPVTATVAPEPTQFTSATTAYVPPSDESPVTMTAPPAPVTETQPAPATPETATAAAPAETATTAPIPEPRAKGTSYILPAMLILVGLGVLVLLFKTSS